MVLACINGDICYAGYCNSDILLEDIEEESETENYICVVYRDHIVKLKVYFEELSFDIITEAPAYPVRSHTRLDTNEW